MTSFGYNTLGFGAYPNRASGSWEILMYTPDKKSEGAFHPNLQYSWHPEYASPGNANFHLATNTGSSAVNRTAFGDGNGVYDAFFTKTGITRIALVDGSSSSMDPTNHTNYLLYDLVEPITYSVHQTLKNIDNVLAAGPTIGQNDTVWGTYHSANNLTAGTKHSGTLTSYAGNMSTSPTNPGTYSNVTPTKFAVWGINRDSDNDVQVLATYAGDLSVGNGKGDSWRNVNPKDLHWSYWGHDFYGNTMITQRIGVNEQGTPGIAQGINGNNSTFTQPVPIYLMGFS